MFLKRLELMGFKSFADRTELDIVPGVTAVVGPNGSGKSNISDAIRWVLGEQSAKSLRGAKMEDVIFSGTVTRKGVNFCEVSLILDNAVGVLPVDYAEVSITRRVYRSGDSEYLINGQSSRLRDISELFMDTGVGKEAYSIIGQGRIEEILSTKSEDRRGVFEEAAGIVKFKVRRRETERKLSDAEQNITRVRDILHELGEQLAPLAADAEKARAYMVLQERASALQIGVLVGEIDLAMQRRAEMEQQADVFGGDIEAVTMEEGLAADALAAERAQADAQDREMQAIQAELLAATARVEQCEADRRVAFERQEHAIAGLDEMRLAWERRAAEEEEADRDVHEMQTKLQRVAAQVEALRAEFEKRTALTEGQGMIAALRTSVQEARANLIEVMRAQAADRNDALHLDNARTRAEARQARIELDLAEAQQTLQTLTGERETVELAMQAVRREREECVRAMTHMETQMADAERVSSAATADLQSIERSVWELSSRLSTLRDLQNDLEGFASGPKAILQASRQDRLKGIRGAVADLILVPTEVELAIETALGGSLQHIVVDADADARAAIDYLKKRQLGRATFLPLGTIRGRRLPLQEVQMVKSSQGFVGIAADLVKTDKPYTAVIDSLLGNVLVTKSLVDANAVARVLQHRVRVVTLGGDVVSPGGAMSGGSVSRRGSGILGRAREVDTLSGQLAALQEERARKETVQQAAIRTLQGLQREFSEHSMALQEKDAILRQWESSMAVLQTSIMAESGRVSAFANEQSALSEEIGAAIKQLEALQVRLQTHDAEVHRGEVTIAELEQQIEAEESLLMGRNDVLTELRVQLAEQEEAWRGLKEAVQRLEGRRQELVDEGLRQRLEQERALERLSSMRRQLAISEEEGKQAQETRDIMQSKVSMLRESRSDWMRALEEREASFAALSARKAHLIDKLHAAELAHSRADAEVETKIELLREEHALGLSLARERYALTDSLSVARPRLAEWRRELEAYGQVNLGAVQEYERVEARHSFLLAQEQDLAAAITNLEQLIHEIDSEMAKRFMDTFVAVREQFREVFTSLFGGGQADVQLVDPTQPLTTGIEIIAEPPGKRMQVLSLLSGGERALTALALLFAVLRVKPVPFCVLDEVEAALDEANVSRFADYLRDFSQNTQFIVITHRRGTMEAADVLYGITMQDSGVSKLVSVRVLDEEPASA